MAPVSLPAPVALARLVDTVTPAGVKLPIYQPKWDGYRVLCGDGQIYSRRGTNLTALFPDLTPALSSRLPRGLALDGEAVCWDQQAGRLDFAALQARMTAGRRLRAVVERRPAQLVVFDILAAADQDLRTRPLRERRRILEEALSGVAAPIVLCQQTTDLTLAREWLRTLTAGGIEGLVIKDAESRYPTQEGKQRIWWKIKAKATLDLLAIGFTGTAATPTTLALAFPGCVDDDGQPVTAGSTTVLSKAAVKSVLPLLRPTGSTFERTFAWTAEPTTVTVVEPFVVEVHTDASAEVGVLRHAARLSRTRPDLDPDEVG